MRHITYISVLVLTFCLVGCASAGPLDIFWPTRQGAVTSNYLGHLNYDGNANFLYHSLADTKIEKELIQIRTMELQALKIAAKGETDIINTSASLMSNAVWGGITALLVGAGVMIPRPQEKGKVVEALHKTPPAVL